MQIGSIKGYSFQKKQSNYTKQRATSINSSVSFSGNKIETSKILFEETALLKKRIAMLEDQKSLLAEQIGKIDESIAAKSKILLAKLREIKATSTKSIASEERTGLIFPEGGWGSNMS